MSDKDLFEFIRSIPKTEIHIHAEMVVGFDSYLALNRKYKIDPSLNTVEAFKDLLKIDSLSVMIKNFLQLQTLFQTPDDFLLVVRDVEAYAKRNNIYYIELFVSPSMVIRQGKISFPEMMDVLVSGFAELDTRTGIDVRLIVDVSRTFGRENAQRNLDNILAYLKKRPTDRILGIGLGGTEMNNSCLEYKEVFLEAKANGLHVVAHAGEEVPSQSIWDALTELKAERIGHGISAVYDPELMDYLRDNKIPLEICPTSNIITGKYVTTYKDHPLKTFYDKGIIVTINTDDPVLFDIELNQEYANMVENQGLKRKDLVEIIKNNLFSTFMPEERKKAIWKDVSKKIKALGAAKS